MSEMTPETRDNLRPQARAISDTLDEWLSRLHGIISSWQNPDAFLAWLEMRGWTVVSVTAGEAHKGAELIVLRAYNKARAEIVDLRKRLEETEEREAHWRLLASPMWVGDDSEGYFVCLDCHERGADDDGTSTIPHAVECLYAATLGSEKKCSLHGVGNCVMEPPPEEKGNAEPRR